MFYVLRVFRVIKDDTGRPINNFPLGFVVNDPKRLFPFLIDNVEDATAFTTVDEYTDFATTHIAMLQSEKSTPEAEFVVQVFEREVRMDRV